MIFCARAMRGLRRMGRERPGALLARRTRTMKPCSSDARGQLSVFIREEAGAIVAYLEYKRDTESHGLIAEEINAARDTFWRNRAANGPTHQAVRQHLKEEAEYLKKIGGGKSR
jgi:hypothetical protein